LSGATLVFGACRRGGAVDCHSAIAGDRVQSRRRAPALTNSHAVDFRSPELRPYLDKYLRGSDGTSAVDRVKLMKLLWDAVGTEFGGRHELYERNYAGAAETIRVISWQIAQASGQSAKLRGFAEECMAEYDLDGWTVPDLITPDDVNLFLGKRPKPPA
jgi:4-hydroxyphenylacetate 3-monooxygenase